MTSASEPLPSDLAAAHAMILAERAARVEAEAIAARAQAENSSTEALIAHLKLEIEKLRRALYGSRSEHKARLLEQMELQLEDLEAAATEDELAAEKAAVRTQTVKSFERRRPSRKPFPDHLPRERVVIAAPESCPCCGSAKLSKLGEDITETLELIPRRWKVIQTVREKFSCRECETITQPPAPFHVTPRGFAGPSLLAMILFEKFGQHQPLNRQSERYRREGIDLSVSTLAAQVGACTSILQPPHALIERHVLTAERLHGDDTTGRSWPRARRSRGISGPMSATTGHSAAGDRRRRSITPRAIDGMNIPRGIFKTSPASCRPMPTADTTSSTNRRALRERSHRHCAGPTQGGSSSNWPISRPMLDAARTPRRSRRSRWRRSSASTRCLILSAA
jgi:transposase